jgi:hypothetical protein
MRMLFAVAALLLASTNAFAITCGTYPDGMPTRHWENSYEQYKQTQRASNRPTFVGDALYMRLIADAALCENGSLSFYEFQARIAEDIAGIAHR